MRERVMNRPLPEVELIDMRQEFQQTGKEQLFSRALVEQTKQALERGEQALILLNRRGYSFVVICRACGAKLECENCAISLTHHKPAAAEASEDEAVARRGQRLECHYCGSSGLCRRGALSARANIFTIWRGVAAGGRTAGGDISVCADWADGSRHECAGGTTWSGCWHGCIQARSICWWARR